MQLDQCGVASDNRMFESVHTGFADEAALSGRCSGQSTSERSELRARPITDAMFRVLSSVLMPGPFLRSVARPSNTEFGAITVRAAAAAATSIAVVSRED